MHTHIDLTTHQKHIIVRTEHQTDENRRPPNEQPMEHDANDAPLYLTRLASPVSSDRTDVDRANLWRASKDPGVAIANNRKRRPISRKTQQAPVTGDGVAHRPDEADRAPSHQHPPS